MFEGTGDEDADEPTAAPLVARDGGQEPSDGSEAKSCPPSMVLVEGQYCPRARHVCRHWLESPALYSYARCAEYEAEAACLEPRQPMRFCIDRDEYTARGERVPRNHQSFSEAKTLCAAEKKHLCRESEWEFACEGEAMLPYPYGVTRDATLCNFDRTDLLDPDGSLRDMREPSDARPSCTSPFGVRNMVGNLDEWTERDGLREGPYPSVLRGGWWMAARNRCRGRTTAHDTLYSGTQTGFRCCAEPNGAVSSERATDVDPPPAAP